jgi:hypothetical protein
LGRFVSADQGQEHDEQSQDPARQPDLGSQQPKDAQPAPAESSGPPAHWSAEDKSTFSKLPPEGQEFLLRRHRDMEADYTRKTQAASTAVEFTNALAPIFQDPVIAGSLAQTGASPYDAVREWGSFHRRAMDTNPQVRLGLLIDLAQRIGFDPARLFSGGSDASPSPPPGLSETDMADPAIRYFADTIRQNQNDLQALRGEIQRRDQAQAQAYEAQAVQAKRWDIDQFAAEKDARGNPLRPDFDVVLPQLLLLYRADPSLSLAEAYDAASELNPQTREAKRARLRAEVEAQRSTERAKAAQRGNLRGGTSPVVRPEASGGGGTRSLRDVIESSADEVGL